MAVSQDINQPTKRCSRCKEAKSLSLFVALRTSRDGRYSWCRVCHAAKMAKARADNPDIYRERSRNQKRDRDKTLQAQRRWRNSPAGKASLRRDHLKYTYGLTEADVEALAAQQKGRCALCQRIPLRLVIDHDHDTQHIRGLLCDRCNTGLGAFGDNIARLQEAIHYLTGNS